MNDLTPRYLRTWLPYAYGSVLLGLFAWVWAYTFIEHLIAVEDGALYYVLGKALYLGEGYVSINTPAATPVTSPPPGYPALIAATMALWSSDMIAVRTANAGYLGGAIVLLFVLFSRLHGGRHLAFVATLAVVVNAHLLHKSMLMMSESSFLLFSTASLLLFTYLRAEETFRKPHIYLLLLGLVSTYHIRTMGIALVVAICLELICQRRWRYVAFISTGFVLSSLPWYLWGRSKGGNAYVGQLFSVDPYQPDLGSLGLGDLLPRVLENLQRYIYREIPDGLLYYVDRNWKAGVNTQDWIVGILLVSLATFGLHQLTSHRRLITFYLAATAGVLLLWPPVWVGTRFLQPAIPLLLLGATIGLFALGRRIVRAINEAWVFHPLMLLPVLCIYGPDVMHLRWLATETRLPDNWAQYLTMAEWVADHTAPETVVACRKPVLFHLHSGRQTVIYKFTEDSEVLIEDLKHNGVDFVVLDELGYTSQQRYLLPAVAEHGDVFPPVHKLRNPNTWLMGFQPDG
ncbi:MAG: phospholipid carrier-dependent glycosyltransferase [Gemmatimonadetes bacterium]|jgi:hypothetical protein|nr:phospholipid carrier-dependent glycosyltransferase [Gemmatimonadota bacterium]MBT5145760.1 phospholipid carrier-dependent glycosyltransferase [Gemmatimonadota bacterium]MBT5588010.1 phospholipid carrier-dependent glycosyltransferase [Gemmatimonadota bacterium]MBT5960824.1 phospholipid carrier-dependent glycosyltransferase [Gemmatimonadota bacterium]MBT6630875.1 phospholipid carrier-dependent glycosyltransferase [Gemmatimonadota bacterium]